MSANACDTRTVVTILSTMRSGSTLLKALLAEAEDVSSLPEVSFQRYARSSDAMSEISRLDASPIIVLKRPAWYHDAGSYPRLPRIDGLKRIVLIRDAYETVRSLKKMTLRSAQSWLGGLTNGWLINYWRCVVERISLLADGNEHTHVVRYEELVAEPVRTTAHLFAFIGSAQQTGVDEYRAPENYEWKWGKDDGGPRIKELRVLPPVPHKYPDRKLLNAIKRSHAAVELRRQLGYADLPE